MYDWWNGMHNNKILLMVPVWDMRVFLFSFNFFIKPLFSEMLCRCLQATYKGLMWDRICTNIPVILPLLPHIFLHGVTLEVSIRPPDVAGNCQTPVRLKEHKPPNWQYMPIYNHKS